jgi:hypothetical protein
MFCNNSAMADKRVSEEQWQDIDRTDYFARPAVLQADSQD